MVTKVIKILLVTSYMNVAQKSNILEIFSPVSDSSPSFLLRLHYSPMQTFTSLMDFPHSAVS
jgi:hypothetical protein